MNQTYPSKTRVIRNDVLIYPEGAPIPLTDPAELVAQGHITEAQAATLPAPAPAPALIDGWITQPATIALHPSKERVERDGVLVYALGDEIHPNDTAELARQGYVPGVEGTLDGPGFEPLPPFDPADPGPHVSVPLSAGADADVETDDVDDVDDVDLEGMNGRELKEFAAKQDPPIAVTAKKVADIRVEIRTELDARAGG